MRHIYFVLLLFTVGCFNPPVIELKSTKALEYHQLDQLDISMPFDISSRIHVNRFVFLEGVSSSTFNVDKLMLEESLIFALDREHHMLFVCDFEGNKTFELSNITDFDLYKRELYTYNKSNGTIEKFSFDGKSLLKTKVGFRGLEFAKLNDSLFVFSTGGLITDDKEANYYQLAYLGNDGIFKGFGLPLRNTFLRTNYYSPNRFSRTNGEIYFIPTFEYNRYLIKSDNILKTDSFDFRRLSLTDSAFSIIKNVENYHFFPYIYDLENTLVNDLHEFYSFTYKGQEGYFLVDRIKKKIVSIGIGSVSTITSHYKNIVPKATYKDTLISVVNPEEFVQDLHQQEKGSEKRKSREDDTFSNCNNFEKIKYPVLLFFTIDVDSL